MFAFWHFVTVQRTTRWYCIGFHYSLLSWR